MSKVPTEPQKLHTFPALPLLFAGMAAFLTLGLLQAMYGPAFSLFQQKFAVDIKTVGLIASAHFVGSASGPLLVAFALKRFSPQVLSVVGLGVLALGVTGVAFAPSWPMALACAVFGGLGLSGVGSSLNAAYASYGTGAVNLVNAVFGVGSILSPLVVAQFGFKGLSAPLLIVVGFAVVSLLFVLLAGVPSIKISVATQTQAQGKGNKLALLFLFMLLMCCYVGLEVGLGAWAATHLNSLGITQAAWVVSAYWMGLTATRIVTGFWGGQVLPSHLVLIGAVVSFLAISVSLFIPALVIPAYIVAGLAIGPIFATTLAWMAQTLSPQMVPYALIGGSLGGVLVPAVIGRLVSSYGANAVPSGLMVLALVLSMVIVCTRVVSSVKPVQNA